MKALVLVRDGIIEHREVPAPTPLGAESVLVRVAYAGVCNSDIRRGFGGGAYHYPLIMGHELSGIVERGFPAGRYRPGDRVVVYPLLPCRRCLPCRSGDFGLCVDYDYFGSRRDGGFAEYLEVPQANLLPVPPGVDLLEAALTEPCAVALHGINRLQIRPGLSAAVIGAGPVGLLAAQWLASRGCAPVYAADIDPDKLGLAAELGFISIDSRSLDPVAAILERNGGRGVERVVEACGLPQTFLQAIRVAGPAAEVLFLGNIRGELVMAEQDFSAILRRELSILGSWNSRIEPEADNDWSTVLAHLGGALQVRPLISHVPDLKDGAQVLRRLAEGSFGSYRRVVLRVRP